MARHRSDDCGSAADENVGRSAGIHLHGFTGSHVLLHLADDATSFTPADAQRLRDELQPAGTSVEIVTYPGTRHGFLADIRPDLFNDAAAELVFERTATLARVAAAASAAGAGDGGAS